jgi:Tol biopolymer transport system component
MSKSFAQGSWSESTQIYLDGRGVQAPAFSADGRYLYYQAVREGGRGGLDIWRVERTRDGWATPVSIGSEVNTNELESQPSLTAEGVLYFTGTLEGVGFDRGIYRSPQINGEYGPRELLGGGINSEYIDYCPWIAADESFLLFASSRPEADERFHLHVSFRQRDGSWSEPVNIHSALGFDGEARFPSVSPDGRFLFFYSGGEAYWVDITPVMELRPTDEDFRYERNNRPS